jgi:DNA repair photolyase
MSRENFKKATIRKNVLRELEKDAKKLKGDKRPILLSFTCDPYQHIDEEYRYTRRAIEILHANNLKVQILTKGGKRSERDFDLLSTKPSLSAYATTLVFMDEKDRQHYEPCAAPTKERIVALKKASELGIETWVSLEPVFKPEDAFAFIKETYNFVNLFKVGKLNYLPEAKDVDWGRFLYDVTALLKDVEAQYYIKKDLGVYGKA